MAKSYFSKEVKPGSFLAIESTLILNSGNTQISWELYEVDRWLAGTALLLRPQKEVPESAFLKYCREQIGGLRDNKDPFKGHFLAMPRGTSAKANGSRKTYDLVYLIEGQWEGNGDDLKYQIVGNI